MRMKISSSGAGQKTSGSMWIRFHSSYIDPQPDIHILGVIRARVPQTEARPNIGRGQTLIGTVTRLFQKIFQFFLQLPHQVIVDCAQLVKANSIQGNKMNDVDVVYTMWENLHKSASMDVGQIGFHKQKAVKKIR